MAAQRLPMTMQEADTQVKLQAVRRPETRLSLAMGQLGNVNNEGRDVWRLETQMPSMVQQGQAQAVRSPLTQQSHPLIQQRNTGNEPQHSPSTQQPPIIQQRNTGNEPQEVNNAWNRQTVSNGYLPQAPAPPAKRRKMTYGISSPFVCR